MRFGEEFHHVKKHRPKGRPPLAEWPVTPTIIAASCSNTAVQAAVDAAVDGDVVGIPGGNCTWSDAVIFIDKDITITGRGVGVTNITSNQQFLFFVHITDPSKGRFRLCHFTVLGDVAEVLKVSSASIAAAPLGRWRFDHVHFNFVDSAVDHGGIHQVGVNYGVVDHCTADWAQGGIFLRHIFGLQNEVPSRGISIERAGSVATATTDQSITGWSSGDTVHIEGADQPEYNGTKIITVTGSNTFTFPVSGTPASPATPVVVSVVIASRKEFWPGNFAAALETGLGGPNFTFVEDCTFRSRRNNFTEVYDASAGGGRVVWRHNTMLGCCRFYNHWTRGTEIAATVMEIYNNTWTYDPGLSPFDPGHVFRIEGGTGVFFNNSSNYNNGAPFVILDDRRSGGFGGPVPGEATAGRTWELCDGTHPWDGNAGDPGAPGWPGLFQIGTGQNPNTSFVNLAAGTVEQPNEPFYMWHNGVQATCAVDGGACTNSIFAFTAPAAYIRSSASPHPNGVYDYREDDTPKPGYTPYPYPHPITLGRGPQASITCPAGAVSIPAGSTTASRQALIDANPNGTAFCLAAGVHTADGSNTPKTGNTFVGEYGAIIDGSGWSSNDREDAFFRAVNNGVTGVTIKNLVLRDGPEYGINSYQTAANWVVEHCEISGNRNGVSLGTAGILRYNYIHHNVGIIDDLDVSLRGGGYTFNASEGAIVTYNEISYNGQEQKFIYGTIGALNQDLYIAHNWVHHNVKDGIWIDGDGAGSIVEYNICEDNGRTGITVEIGTTVIVRYNIVRRSVEEGILISATRNSQIYDNILEDNTFGLALFLDGARLSEIYDPWVVDMRDNTFTNNYVRVPAGGGAFASMLSFRDVADQTPWLTNTKNNHWQSNRYVVPSNPTTGNYFVWNGNRTFAQWQAVPQDSLGSIQ